MYEILENAGLDNQVIVHECASLKEAKAYVRGAYTIEEVDELRVDITFNGSTEFKFSWDRY